MSDAAKKHLVFHIGDCKTGTTTIQEALAAGKVEIPGRKLLYPASLNHNYLNAQFERTATDKGPGPDRPGMPSLPNLAQSIAESDADYIILSGEHFEPIDQKLFEQTVAEHFLPVVDDFRLLAYVRPHAARVLSTFAEQSKIGRHHESLEAYHARSLRNRRFVYAPRFAGWRARYGARFTLRPMVRDALVDGSILDDFMRAAIGEQPFKLAPIANANESLCLEDIMLLRVLQQKTTKIDLQMRSALGWDISKLMAELPRPSSRTRFALHRSVAEQIHAAYAEDAKKVDKRFFANNPVMLRELEKSVDTAIAEPQSLEPTDYFSADELRTIDLLGGLLADMISAKKANWAAFFRQRREDIVNAL